MPLDLIFTPETVIELPPSARLAVSLSAPLTASPMAATSSSKRSDRWPTRAAGFSVAGSLRLNATGLKVCRTGHAGAAGL